MIKVNVYRMEKVKAFTELSPEEVTKNIGVSKKNMPIYAGNQRPYKAKDGQYYMFVYASREDVTVDRDFERRWNDMLALFNKPKESCI